MKKTYQATDENGRRYRITVEDVYPLDFDAPDLGHARVYEERDEHMNQAELFSFPLMVAPVNPHAGMGEVVSLEVLVDDWDENEISYRLRHRMVPVERDHFIISDDEVREAAMRHVDIKTYLAMGTTEED